MQLTLLHLLVFVVTVLFKHLNISSLQLLLTERVMFGAPVVVQVDSQSQGPANIVDIIVPSLEEGKIVHSDVKADTLS